MESDLECPYCGNEQDVCNDDGHGIDESETHQEQCLSCLRHFVFYSSHSISYTASKADCLNGKPHKFRKLMVLHYPDWVKCKDCGHEERGRYCDL